MSEVSEPSVQPPAKVYVLRSCDTHLRSHGGFQWPASGFVSAPDWRATAACGHGLHGLLWGRGDGSLLDWSADAKWMVVEIDDGSYVCIGGDKVKFPSGNVVFCGDKSGAITDIVSRGADPAMCVGSTLTGGYRSTLTGGYRSTLTGGDDSTLTGGYRSTLTGGYRSTLTGGDRSTLTGGDRSTLTGGDDSTLTGGYRSTLTGGDDSTLTGGDDSTLTGGDDSTLTGGDDSTLTGGYRSTLTGGDDSTLTGGDGSSIAIRYWDATRSRYRLAIGYVEDGGLVAGKAYIVRDEQIVEAV